MSNQNNGVWTPERVDRLRQLYAQNWSARLIADEIGGSLTRSSVMGKIKRLGLSRKGGVVGRDGRVTLGGGQQMRPKVVAPRLVEVDPVGVPLLDLQPGQCRFPYGNGPFTFCGCQALKDQSYCASHYELTHMSARYVAEAA